MFGMLNVVDPSHQPSDTCGLLSLSLLSLPLTRFPRALVLVETGVRSNGSIANHYLKIPPSPDTLRFSGYCSSIVVYGKQHSCCGAENAEAFLTPVPDELSHFHRPGINETDSLHAPSQRGRPW